MLSASYSKPKLVLYALMSAVFVLIGFWILQDPDPDAKALFSAWVGIGFFGPCTVVFVRRLRKTREILRVDGMGVLDRRVTDRTIPWSAIARITERQVRHQVIFNLHLTGYLSDFVDSNWQRFTQSLNGLFGLGRNTISITANGLTVSADELRAALAAHHPIG